MGAQPDTSTSAPEVWHGVQQILAPIFVPRLLATYLEVPFMHQRSDNLAPVLCKNSLRRDLDDPNICKADNICQTEQLLQAQERGFVLRREPIRVRRLR